MAIETMTAGGGQVVPGITVEQIEKINTDVPGRGPHTVTGPIYVNDAPPGGVVKIHINKIKMRDYATNNSSSTGGLFPEIFEPKVDSYYLDTEKMQMQFEPNIVVPLAPFPGIIPKNANAPAASDIPKKDTAKFWVRTSKNTDLMTAMKVAALASVDPGSGLPDRSLFLG